jgi:hypothetical protein
MVKTVEAKNNSANYSEGLLSRQIERYYSLSAERQFVESLRDKQTKEGQIALYSRENVLKFLLEFAAGVKKTHITYQCDNRGQLVYPGINLEMEAMMEEAVFLSGNGAREQAELAGWRRTQQLFSNEGVNHVLQLSPPDSNNSAHGDYGFLFWFERQGGRVTNHILRYNESRFGLGESERIYEALGGGSGQKTDKEFLANPQGYSTSSVMVKEELKRLGFELDNRGHLLEQALLSDPQFLASFYRYQQALLGNTFNQREAQAALIAMYKLAESKSAVHGLLERRLFVLPPIFMGGSCPTISYGSSVFGYANFLYGEPFTCPKCGYKSYVPVGNRCPSCKITKEEWAKEQEKAGNDNEICD